MSLLTGSAICGQFEEPRRDGGSNLSALSAVLHHNGDCESGFFFLTRRSKADEPGVGGAVLARLGGARFSGNG